MTGTGTWTLPNPLTLNSWPSPASTKDPSPSHWTLPGHKSPRTASSICCCEHSFIPILWSTIELVLILSDMTDLLTFETILYLWNFITEPNITAKYSQGCFFCWIKSPSAWGQQDFQGLIKKEKKLVPTCRKANRN